MTVDEAKRLYNLNQLPPATWDTKYTDKRLLSLHPLVRIPFANIVNRVESELKKKIRLTADGGFRGFLEQDQLYGHSRTEEQLKKVGVHPAYAKPSETWKTNAKGGQSYHNYGLAVDVCIINQTGADFNITEDIAGIFKSEGWQWMYDLIKKDKPHFQLTFGLSINELYLKYQSHDIDKNGYLNL